MDKSTRNKYKICQCPKCGSIQLTTSCKSLKCKYCGKTSKIHSKTCIGPSINILKTTNDSKLAIKLTQEFKKRQAIKK